MSINQWVGVGRITKDPVMRKTQSGMSVVSFNLACNRRVKKGEHPEADYISCVAWNATADFMDKYVKKGALLGVLGRIQTRNYDDASGKKVYVTEVIAENVQFLESKKDVENNASTTTQVSSANTYTPNESHKYEDEGFVIASDDLPF